MHLTTEFQIDAAKMDRTERKTRQCNNNRDFNIPQWIKQLERISTMKYKTSTIL